jgi:peroxiredoxin
MRHLLILAFALFLSTWGLQAQTDTTSAVTAVKDFTLPNVDGSQVSLSSLASQKAVVVIFTGNHCVYSKKYEDRILALAREYGPKQVSVLLVNSNDPVLSEDDRLEVMQMRAKEKTYPCPYLHDPDRKVAELFGATKNPETFVLTPNGDAGFTVAFHGKIDDSPLLPEKVEHRYLNDVLNDILAGKPGPFQSQAVIGCGIKGVE